MPIYQQILTILLQTYRAKYLLQRTRLQDIQLIKDARLKQLSYRLRYQLIWFADILRHYLTETVISQCTSAMGVAMEKAQDIDEMANIHIKYLARLQEQALLSDTLKPIYRAVISILDLAVIFHDTLKRSSREPQASLSSKPANAKAEGKRSSRLKRRKSVIPSVVETLDDDDSASDRDEPDQDADGMQTTQQTSSFEGNIRTVNTELTRLLPFLTAGLRNIGRVGAEPAWEMLAEKLEWQKRDGAYSGLR
jgi:gamma-tubulin complex component 5